MNIYIGNIPKGTRPSELKRLIKDQIRPNIFQKLYSRLIDLGRFDQGVNINIHKQKNKRGPYRYGKLRFRSNRLGELALEVLDGCTLRGESLAIRPYIRRKKSNDLRITHHQPLSHGIIERRKNDRREH
ncbi:MAG: RNA recognition motif domain-containing protein [Thiohalomonadales bacterium]